jgi:drug/metabolite transporter (DMT)-like permease
MQMLCAAVGAIVIAFFLGEFDRFRPADLSSESLVALAYLVIVGSIVGFAAYVWLLRVAPLSKVTTYAYVNPVVAFVLGAIVLGEPITASTVVAAAIIIFAVALIVTARGRDSRARERERRDVLDTSAPGGAGIDGARPEFPASEVLTSEALPAD